MAGLIGIDRFPLNSLEGTHPAWTARPWGLFIGLLILVPITSLFIGVRLPAGSSLPLPNFPADNSPGSSNDLLYRSVDSGGRTIGPFGAALLGLFAGVFRGAWDTYSLFTALEFSLLAILFSASVRQRYRTPIYQLARQPLVSALLMIPLHLILFIIGAFFSIPSNVPVAARLDFALSNSGIAALTFGGEMLIAGVIAQLAAANFPIRVGREETSATITRRTQSRNTLYICHGHIHHHIVIDLAHR